MQTIHIDEVPYNEAYGIQCAALTTPGCRASFYPTFCKIAPNGKTTAHAHVEPEIFFIVRGSGSMRMNGETRQVGTGDLVRIPPFTEHTLENDTDGELVFVSVYGEDLAVPGVPKAVLITAAPPTPNGPLHLGHISGPYLAADVMRRYLSQRGASVHSHCGSDDHQNYVDEAARVSGQSAEAFREAMRRRISAGFAATAVSFDELIEPKRDADYQARARAFASRAVAAGVVVRERLSLPFCEHCDLFSSDARLTGSCPSCGEASHGGCESCGVVAPAHQLRDPHCARCTRPTTTREAEVHTFALHKFVAPIREALRALPLSHRLQALVSRVCEAAETTVLVTEPHGTGIAMPGFAGETLHVWFEAAAHYESFAHESRTWIHCFGFDNAFHYLLFIPALLRALDDSARLPDVIVTNEFLQLERQKFSTSRKHAIWADDFVADADLTRLYLALHRPVSTTADFSRADFAAFASRVGKQLQQLVERARHCTPSRSEHAIVECNRFTRDLELFYAPATLNLRRAGRRLLELIDATLHGDRDGERLRLQTLATIMAPILPATAQTLAHATSVSTGRWVNDWTNAS